MNFYYIMKDQHKKIAQRKRQDQAIQSETTSEIDDFHPPAFLPPRDRLPPPRIQPPSFFRTRLPIFIRFRKQSVPVKIQFH